MVAGRLVGDEFFRLPGLAAAGADAIKIEGRMKSVGYVGAAVRAYRAALDYIQEQRAAGAAWEEIILPPVFTEEIAKVGTRGQTENFFSTVPSSSAMLYDRMREIQPCAPVGIVRGSSPLLLETRNVLEVGDEIEHLGRKLEPTRCTVLAMTAADGTEVRRANPGCVVAPLLAPAPDSLLVNDLFRKTIIQPQPS